MKPDLIFTHADADGICAASILLSRFPGTEIFFTKPVSLLSDLKYRKEKNIIIADIALDKRDAEKVVKELQKKNFLYFDHHPYFFLLGKEKPTLKRKLLQKNFIMSKTSTSENVYKYYKKDIPEERVWPALYGAIADYCADTKFVKQHLKDWDIRALYFEVSTLVLGIKNREFGNYNAKKNIVKTLSRGENPSDIEGLVKSAKKAVIEEFKLYELVKKQAKKKENFGYFYYRNYFGFRGPAALFAATATDSPLGVSIFKRSGYLDITLRSRIPLPLNKLAEYSGEYVGGSGGGHPEAAGARIPKDSLLIFLNKLSQLLEKEF